MDPRDIFGIQVDGPVGNRQKGVLNMKEKIGRFRNAKSQKLEIYNWTCDPFRQTSKSPIGFYRQNSFTRFRVQKGIRPTVSRSRK